MLSQKQLKSISVYWNMAEQVKGEIYRFQSELLNSQLKNINVQLMQNISELAILAHRNLIKYNRLLDRKDRHPYALTAFADPISVTNSLQILDITADGRIIYLQDTDIDTHAFVMEGHLTLEILFKILERFRTVVIPKLAEKINLE